MRNASKSELTHMSNWICGTLARELPAAALDFAKGLAPFLLLNARGGTCGGGVIPPDHAPVLTCARGLPETILQFVVENGLHFRDGLFHDILHQQLGTVFAKDRRTALKM